MLLADYEPSPCRDNGPHLDCDPVPKCTANANRLTVAHCFHNTANNICREAGLPVNPVNYHDPDGAILDLISYASSVKDAKFGNHCRLTQPINIQRLGPLKLEVPENKPTLSKLYQHNGEGALQSVAFDDDYRPLFRLIYDFFWNMAPKQAGDKPHPAVNSAAITNLISHYVVLEALRLGKTDSSSLMEHEPLKRGRINALLTIDAEILRRTITRGIINNIECANESFHSIYQNNQPSGIQASLNTNITRFDYCSREYRIIGDCTHERVFMSFFPLKKRTTPETSV